MFKIEDLMSENFSAYPMEVQEYMKKFNEKLRESIKVELVNHMSDKMLKNIDKSKDYFINVLSDILENGCKGFNKMSTRALINMYLERKSEEDFGRLIEKVSAEVDI